MSVGSSISDNSSLSTSELRKAIRKQRRQLSPYQQAAAAQACLTTLIHRPEFKHAQHIGLYLHAFGEVSTHQIILNCFKQHKRVYLPRICPMNQVLTWVPITLQQYQRKQFYRHRLGMHEPMQNTHRRVEHLDLLIMPLLACDQVGMRIGMGGGYYDRTLANAAQRPFRLGLAHDFQYVAQHFKAQIWDQGLDALLCPSAWKSFKRIRR